MPDRSSSRRDFLKLAALGGTALFLPKLDLHGENSVEPAITPKLRRFSYGQVTLHGELHQAQLQNTQSVLMSLNEDGLMKPFRQMAGLPAPGEDLGGWYIYKPDYDYRKDSAGLCPGGTFGQWISALSRMYAITGDTATREKVLRLNRLFAQCISSGFFEKNRFPAYCYDKLVCGLVDAQQLAHDPQGFEILNRTTKLALPHLPERAVDREQNWRPGKDISYSWDESYTLPENLFLACQAGAGKQYRELAVRYLDDKTYFDPLARGENVFAGKHAYSYVNALSSAMLAYLTLGSEKHLRAAKNAFEMLVTTQSFATGGWGPDEQLRAPGSGALAESLATNHKSFETPCGSYAHFKLTRYLLQVTADSRYGDSMEQVMYNTVLGAKPLRADGTAFYYSDYNYEGHKDYSPHRWPCCSGTLPQVAADYRINTYFQDANGIYINLYIPSRVVWTLGSTQVSLSQSGDYPIGDSVRIRLEPARPLTFALRLRIPAWTEAASVELNGQRQNIPVAPGTFAEVRCEWKKGDEVTLRTPMKIALEAIDSEHPDIVATKRGPLVLCPLISKKPTVRRQQLIEAKQECTAIWVVATKDGLMKLVPFTSIRDEPYTTYLRCS